MEKENQQKPVVLNKPHFILVLSDSRRKQVYQNTFRTLPYIDSISVTLSHAKEAHRKSFVGAIVIEYNEDDHQPIAELITHYRNLATSRGSWLIILDTYNTLSPNKAYELDYHQLINSPISVNLIKDISRQVLIHQQASRRALTRLLDDLVITVPTSRELNIVLDYFRLQMPDQYIKYLTRSYKGEKELAPLHKLNKAKYLLDIMDESKSGAEESYSLLRSLLRDERYPYESHLLLSNLQFQLGHSELAYSHLLEAHKLKGSELCTFLPLIKRAVKLHNRKSLQSTLLRYLASQRQKSVRDTLQILLSFTDIEHYVWLSRVATDVFSKYRRSISQSDRKLMDAGLNSIHSLGLLHSDKPLKAAVSYSKGELECREPPTEDEELIQSIRLLYCSRVGQVSEVKDKLKHVDNSNHISPDLKEDLSRSIQCLKNDIAILNSTGPTTEQVNAILNKYPLSKEITELTVQIDPEILLRSRTHHHIAQLTLHADHGINRDGSLDDLLMVKRYIQNRQREQEKTRYKGKEHKHHSGNRWWVKGFLSFFGRL